MHDMEEGERENEKPCNNINLISMMIMVSGWSYAFQTKDSKCERSFLAFSGNREQRRLCQHLTTLKGFRQNVRYFLFGLIANRSDELHFIANKLDREETNIDHK